MAELIPRPLVEIAPGGEILVKDKGRLPTGSFKARRLALAVSMAKELGVRTVAMPTNGMPARRRPKSTVFSRSTRKSSGARCGRCISAVGRPEATACGLRRPLYSAGGNAAPRRC